MSETLKAYLAVAGCVVFVGAVYYVTMLPSVRKVVVPPGHVGVVLADPWGGYGPVTSTAKPPGELVISAEHRLCTIPCGDLPFGRTMNGLLTKDAVPFDVRYSAAVSPRCQDGDAVGLLAMIATHRVRSGDVVANIEDVLKMRGIAHSIELVVRTTVSKSCSWDDVRPPSTVCKDAIATALFAADMVRSDIAELQVKEIIPSR